MSRHSCLTGGLQVGRSRAETVVGSAATARMLVATAWHQEAQDMSEQAPRLPRKAFGYDPSAVDQILAHISRGQ